MKKGSLTGNIMLILTAAIWGIAFVAQRAGMDHVGPFTFMATRYALAALSLGIISFLVFRSQEQKNSKTDYDLKTTLKSGLVTGIILFTASSLQQIGLIYSTAGKAAFITTLYIVIVPFFGIFLGKKIGASTWVGVILSICGLYLLTVKQGLSMEYGDLIVLAGSFLWAGHILVIDHYSNRVEPVYMSFLQFVVAFLLSVIVMFLFETPTWDTVMEAKIPIFYAGVLSAGVGYTLQMIAQKSTDPTVASLIMSLEAVFGAVGGYFLLHEILSFKELLGCIVMFVAIIIAQIPAKKEESLIAHEKVEME